LINLNKIKITLYNFLFSIRKKYPFDFWKLSSAIR
jgi:hypothetical protein